MPIKSILKYIYEQRWTLGFVEQPLSSIVEGEPFNIKFVKAMPRDRWFADPFILDYDDCKIQVLVEEFCYNIRRGRIARLTIDHNSYRLLDYRIILDLPTHLSFPFIQRKGEKVYIYPENSASGCWSMYEYTPETDAIIKIKNVVDKPLTDAVYVRHFIPGLIFATQLPEQNGSKLLVYSLEGELQQELSFQSCVARNAGDWFKVGDKVYRPAQDCNGAYGTAVILQEVTRSNDGSFKFINIRRIESKNPQYTTGCHTFNSFKDLVVVDVHGYRRPWIAKVAESIRMAIKGSWR